MNWAAATRLLVAWVALTAALIAISLVVTLVSMNSQIRETTLPRIENTLNKAFADALEDSNLTAVIQHKLATDLGDLPILQLISTVSSCSVTPSDKGTIMGDLVVRWRFETGSKQQRMELRCDPNMPLFLLAGLLAALGLAVLALLPPVLPADQRLWVKQLQNSGLSLDRALEIARHEDSLSFDLGSSSVCVRGMRIELPQTPLLYLLWYAKRRVAGEEDGWFLNPQLNRPEQEVSVELCDLMQRCGGHKKAINDLQRNGLRAKTLDQNRNRVKETLTKLLGYELAAPYLFEMERDLASGRFCYRLSLEPANIRLPEGL